MDDNARPHRALVVTDYLRDVYIWDIIGRRVRERTPPVQTLNE
jgi:hypothetical protein